MPQLFLNNFQTQFIASVKAMPDSASPALELDYGVLRVSDGAAGLLLNPIPGSWYVLTSFKRAGSAETDYEVMHVTAVDNAVIGECRLTVLRGQEGTTPKAYVAGDIMEMRLTAGGMNQHVQTTDARMVNARAPAGAAGGVLSGEYPNPGFAQAMATAADLGGKVDKVAGKVLSANDYTNAERVKLANVAEQATKNATDADLRDRASHTGTQAIATIAGLSATLVGKQDTLVSGDNIKTVNGLSLLGNGNIAITGGNGAKSFYFFTADHSFTVLAGMTSIRYYAGGKGANSYVEDFTNFGGGGGGFSFGDIAVATGDVVAVTVSGGVVTIKLNGVTMGVANGTSSINGGTATKHASVTNGGAYSGGNGRINSGGASCGSPLGNGFSGGSTGGGGGIGGEGGPSGGGGGGAGEAGGGNGSSTYGGGSAVNVGRGILTAFADPLLKHAVGGRSVSVTEFGIRVSPTAGVGGAGAQGGDFGGGSSGGYAGGLMGGGGYGSGVSGGAGGYGGGGGVGTSGFGVGGVAFFFLYY